MNKTNVKNYIINVLNGMALGLFSTLIIGVILKQIGEILEIESIIYFGEIGRLLMGPGIGVGVAYSLKAPILAIISAAVVGAIGAETLVIENGINSFVVGEPVGALIASLIGVEASKFFVGRTKVDILIVPATTILIGGFVGIFISPIISSFMNSLGYIINISTELHPIPMGILVSLIMGMMLTLPISSAAIAISLNLEGLAAGAALIGGSSQMIGFAVMSFKANGFGGLIAQGLGTSMIQIPNIIKKPIIWIPPIISSIILGPISTKVFELETNSIGAGMGTSGLIGPFTTYTVMAIENNINSYFVILSIISLHFLFPAIISYSIYKYLERKSIINQSDLKLDNN